MLAANVSASAFLQKHRHPALFRVHEGPTTDRLQRLREFLAGFGLQIAGGDTPSAKDYAQLLEQIKDRPDKALLQTVMLRSLRQAQYSPENLGHFGLSYEAYTHFTSPIRRYPDLLIHRAIKAVLQKQKYHPQVAEAMQAAGEAAGGSSPGDVALAAWERIGLHCSMTERRADEATREVDAWLKCYYMQDRIGEEFDGSIAAVVSFGLFVALDDIHIEGLLHVSDLGADYFRYDEAGHVMVGERTGRRYRLADRLRVQVVRADLETKRIDFRLVSTAPEKSGLAKSAKSAKQAKVTKAVKSDKAAKTSTRVAPMPLAKQVAPDPQIQASRTLPGKAKPAQPLKSTKVSKASKAAAKSGSTARSKSTKKGTSRG